MVQTIKITCMKTRLLLLLLLCSMVAVAQKKPKGDNAVFTGQRTRIIFLADTTDYSDKKLRPENGDTTLAELLTRQVMNKQIKAYAADDTTFATPLRVKDLLHIVAPPGESVDVRDPVTKKIVHKVIAVEFNFGQITNYRLLEEWRLDTKTGSSELQILALAPLYEARPMYWLKYADVKNLLTAYEREHANCSFPLAAWMAIFTEKEPLINKK